MCLESFFFLLQTSRTFDIDTREKNPTLRIFYPVGSTFIRLVFPLRPRVCLCCILNRSRNEEKVMKGNPLGNNFSLEGERWRRLAAQQCSVRKNLFVFSKGRKATCWPSSLIVSCFSPRPTKPKWTRSLQGLDLAEGETAVLHGCSSPSSLFIEAAIHRIRMYIYDNFFSHWNRKEK